MNDVYLGPIPAYPIDAEVLEKMVEKLRLAARLDRIEETLTQILSQLDLRTGEEKP